MCNLSVFVFSLCHAALQHVAVDSSSSGEGEQVRRTGGPKIVKPVIRQRSAPSPLTVCSSQLQNKQQSILTNKALQGKTTSKRIRSKYRHQNIWSSLSSVTVLPGISYNCSMLLFYVPCLSRQTYRDYLSVICLSVHLSVKYALMCCHA